MDTHTLRDDVGQMLLVGFDGTELSPAVAQALAAGDVAGVVLFRRNLGSVDQVLALNAHIHRVAGSGVPLVAIDQEGGRVQRLREPLTVLPPMGTLGRLRDMETCVQVGLLLAEELGTLGFNLNFAPVVDVATNPDNPIIGDRAFSDDPEWAARMAGALMLGLIQGGMVPCAKHFPGHGDTDLDSHVALPVVAHPMERLQRVELHPFRRLVRADVPMIMTAHLRVPAGDPERIATLSPFWLQDILRRQLGFGGVIISDDLEMQAALDQGPIESVVAQGLEAGIDLFLICRDPERWQRAHAALLELGGSSEVWRDRIALAAGRVRQLRSRWLRPWEPDIDELAVLGCEAHRALAADIVRRAAQREA
jgi:beta-N-acetylhexosaminidase